MASWDRKTDSFEKVAVRGSGRCFEIREDSARCFKHCVLVGLGERRNSDDFADDLSPVVRIGENLGQSSIVGRGKDGVDQRGSRSWLGCLRNDCSSA